MIVVDLETTDLLNDMTQDPEQQPGIVQIGLIETFTDRVPQTHEWKINPEKPAHLWDASAIKTHGIKPEDVAAEPTLPAIFPGLAAICRRHDTWIGFNNSFDRKVLYYQCLRYGWQWKFPWPSIDVDVMAVSRDILNIAGKRDVKHPKLVELHEALFGTAYEGAHDALRDCRATLKCWQELVDRGYLWS